MFVSSWELCFFSFVPIDAEETDDCLEFRVWHLVHDTQFLKVQQTKIWKFNTNQIWKFTTNQLNLNQPTFCAPEFPYRINASLPRTVRQGSGESFRAWLEQRPAMLRLSGSRRGAFHPLVRWYWVDGSFGNPKVITTVGMVPLTLVK